jgi:hypothetical protein
MPVQAIFQEGYAFSPAPGCEAYTPPPEGPIDSYTSFIRSLPDTAPPEVQMNSQGCSLHLHAGLVCHRHSGIPPMVALMCLLTLHAACQ